MIVHHCDGCLRELNTVPNTMEARRLDGGKIGVRTCIVGRRVDGLSGTLGNALVRDDQEFHWCFNCAQVAFGALDASTS